MTVHPRVNEPVSDRARCVVDTELDDDSLVVADCVIELTGRVKDAGVPEMDKLAAPAVGEWRECERVIDGIDRVHEADDVCVLRVRLPSAVIDHVLEPRDVDVVPVAVREGVPRVIDMV